MTTEEFSTEFDVQVSAYYPNGILFDEYEKSVYLTHAQEMMVLQLYTDFEKKEVVREALAPLVKTFVTSEEYIGNDETGCEETELYPISDMSYFYKLPDNLWLILYEEVSLSSKNKCLNGKRIPITPTTHDKVTKILGNPFKRPSENRALRINISENVVEIISEYGIEKYYVRYLHKLKPIILTKLTDSVSINGVVDRTECELPDTIHKDILNMAVQMALQSRVRFDTSQQSQQPQQQNEE